MAPRGPTSLGQHPGSPAWVSALAADLAGPGWVRSGPDPHTKREVTVVGDDQLTESVRAALFESELMVLNTEAALERMRAHLADLRRSAVRLGIEEGSS